MSIYEREDIPIKNHKYVDGRLIQTNKKFSALKEKQKTKISEWLYVSFKEYLSNHRNLKSGEDDIVLPVIEKIKEADIWIPDYEIYEYYRKRIPKLRKRYEHEMKIEKQNDNEALPE